MQTRKRKKKKTKNKIQKAIFFLKIKKILKKFISIFSVLLFFFLCYIFIKYSIFNKIKYETKLYLSTFLYRNICVNIEINGVFKSNIDEIKHQINIYCNKDNKINLDELFLNILNDPWIKDISIIRKIPNTLKIEIKEYTPFALWKNKEELFLLSSNNEVININKKEIKEFYHLLIISGEKSRDHVESLFNLLSSNQTLFSEIKSALMVGKRRWNFELKSKVVIKMPENNLFEAWEKLDNILYIYYGDSNLKTIDLRNKERIFIEEY